MVHSWPMRSCTRISRLFTRPHPGEAGFAGLRGCVKSTFKLPRALLPRIRHVKSNFQRAVHLWSPQASSPPALVCSALAFAPTSEAPSGWLAVAVFVGMPTALWIYKCFMMVLFQRKIIYMGYVPPGARQERLEDQKINSSLRCEEVELAGDKAARLSGILVHHKNLELARPQDDPTIVLLYLQGNAGTPLARLPVFERLLLGVRVSGCKGNSADVFERSAIFALAPRSFWKSTPRRPTEQGITSDYKHALDYICRRFPTATIILYGHSLGGAAAVCLSALMKDTADYENVKGLILENPFASIPAMVKALYPQRWLPYHYLGGLAFDRWDAVSAMQCAREGDGSLLARLSRSTLFILSKKDEIVPHEQGLSLFEAAAQGGLEDGETGGGSKLVVLRSALHENAWTERQWRTEMELYLTSQAKTT